MSKDPLKQGPEASKELFKRFSREANGFPLESTVDAAMNVIMNAIRQSHASSQKAEASFDELFGKAKGILMSHYDASGKRRAIFPFHQTIEVPRMIFPKKIN